MTVKVSVAVSVDGGEVSFRLDIDDAESGDGLENIIAQRMASAFVRETDAIRNEVLCVED